MRHGAHAAHAAVVLAFLHLHLHLHLHRFHGPSLDYGGLAAAAFASWVGVPGPGEPLLIAAGILAAQGKLDLIETLVVAFGAAVAGGIVGWLIGLKAGRSLLERSGPFLRARRRALRRGDEVFQRYPAFAIIMTTSWMAGVNQARTGVYMLWNAVGALIWTLAIGLGGYFAGPPVVELVGDAGWLTVIGVVGVLLTGVSLELGWRRRRRRSDSGTGAESQ
jgi:membrane protein DedA with SNARE-associated domain